MPTLHLQPNYPKVSQGEITLSAVLEFPNQAQYFLWYRLPAQYQAQVTQSCDPFVIATVFLAMQKRLNLQVHGTVSPSLLQNLEEFQAAWACWKPDRYSPIQISADIEQEWVREQAAPEALMVFSGGVDSCFTAWRHTQGQCGRSQRPLKAGVMVHGFDIPLDQPDVFDRAAQKSQKMLSSLGLDLIPIATNFRELGQDWEDAHGAALAACVSLLQPRYDTVLIPSTEPYQSILAWGSNPVTDKFLSSATFQVVHDGAAFTRIQKVGKIANWPEARAELRVCWQGNQGDRNCGQCEKCIRTILNFRVLGCGLPPCFEQDVTDSQIANLTGLNPLQLGELEQILAAAIAAKKTDSWVNALKFCIWKNRTRLTWKTRLRPLKASLKQTWQQFSSKG